MSLTPIIPRRLSVSGSFHLLSIEFTAGSRQRSGPLRSGRVEPYARGECSENGPVVAFIIEKEDSDGIVRLVFSGHTGLNDVVLATERIMEDGRIVCTRRLFDFRKAEVHFSADDIGQISDRSLQNEPGESRIAVLVRGDLQYGLSAMFGGLAWSSSREFKIFRDEAEAVSWLTAED